MRTRTLTLTLTHTHTHTHSRTHTHTHTQRVCNCAGFTWVRQWSPPGTPFLDSSR